MKTATTVRWQGWVIVGLFLATLHLCALAAVSLFDDGALTANWIERVPHLFIAAMPAGMALVGLRNPEALKVACLLSFVLSFYSLAGATLPLLIPGIFYYVGLRLSNR